MPANLHEHAGVLLDRVGRLDDLLSKHLQDVRVLRGSSEIHEGNPVMQTPPTIFKPRDRSHVPATPEKTIPVRQFNFDNESRGNSMSNSARSDNGELLRITSRQGRCSSCFRIVCTCKKENPNSEPMRAEEHEDESIRLKTDEENLPYPGSKHTQSDEHVVGSIRAESESLQQLLELRRLEILRKEKDLDAANTTIQTLRAEAAIQGFQHQNLAADLELVCTQLQGMKREIDEQLRSDKKQRAQGRARCNKRHRMKNGEDAPADMNIRKSIPESPPTPSFSRSSKRARSVDSWRMYQQSLGEAQDVQAKSICQEQEDRMRPEKTEVEPRQKQQNEAHKILEDKASRVLEDMEVALKLLVNLSRSVDEFQPQMPRKEVISLSLGKKASASRQEAGAAAIEVKRKRQEALAAMMQSELIQLQHEIADTKRESQNEMTIHRSKAAQQERQMLAWREEAVVR